MIDEQKLRELAEISLSGDDIAYDILCEDLGSGVVVLALLDELATLRSERTAWRVTAENAEALVADLRKQNEAQKNEWLSWNEKRAALEKDAARYRWMREGESYEVRMKKSIVITSRNPERDYPEALDAAIDAAIDAMKETP